MFTLKIILQKPAPRYFQINKGIQFLDFKPTRDGLIFLQSIQRLDPNFEILMFCFLDRDLNLFIIIYSFYK